MFKIATVNIEDSYHEVYIDDKLKDKYENIAKQIHIPISHNKVSAPVVTNLRKLNEGENGVADFDQGIFVIATKKGTRVDIQNVFPFTHYRENIRGHKVEVEHSEPKIFFSIDGGKK